VNGDKNGLAALVDRHLPRIGRGGLEASHSGERSRPKNDASMEYRMAFEGTAQVLLGLPERVGEFGYQVCYEQSVIIDRSARRGREKIASASNTRWFVDWLKAKQ
jgi:hypothetical protein